MVKVSNMPRHLEKCCKRQIASSSADLSNDEKRAEDVEMLRQANAGNVTFLMQVGVICEMITIDSRNATINSLKETACNIILQKLPQHGVSRLQERIILFRHDYDNANILLPVISAADVTEGCLLEIVISANYPGDDVHIRPHHLTVFSYKSPTFCDYCGEMLFGFVRQGLKCDRCGLNFHKRCAHLIPNNCSHAQQRNDCAGPLLDNRHAPLRPDVTGAVDGQRDEAPFLPSGRPAWVERELAGRICTPHTFQVHSYGRPTMCLYCKRLLVGLFRQGLQCSQCNFNVHRSCVDKVVGTCHGTLLQNWAHACERRHEHDV